MTENEQARGLESQIRQIAEDAARKVVKAMRTPPDCGPYEAATANTTDADLGILVGWCDILDHGYALNAAHRHRIASLVRELLRRYEARPSAVVTAEDVQAAHDAFYAQTDPLMLYVEFAADFLTARLAERSKAKL